MYNFTVSYSPRGISERFYRSVLTAGDELKQINIYLLCECHDGFVLVINDATCDLHF